MTWHYCSDCNKWWRDYSRTVTRCPYCGKEVDGKVCCNCKHNIREKDRNGMITHCQCDVDNHRLNYIECMEGWCRHWAKDRKFESEVEE